MKLKEGMYVRTKYGINKIDKTFYTVSGVNHSYVELENCYIDDEYDLRQGINIENIIKASFNIIDLIEVGDYVNGRIVDKYKGKLGNLVELPNGKWEFIELLNESYYISSIVTKEQFKSMEYEVE